MFSPSSLVAIMISESDMAKCTTAPQRRSAMAPAFGLGVIRQAIIAVLIRWPLRRTGEVGLQFDGCHRRTVDKQHQINGKFTGRVILQLRHHAQDIGTVALNDCCIALVAGAASVISIRPQPAMEKPLAPTPAWCLVFSVLYPEAIHQHFKGFGPVEPFQLVPFSCWPLVLIQLGLRGTPPLGVVELWNHPASNPALPTGR